jgi:hypothetical protein
MNRIEIKGQDNKDKLVDALLESGYQVLISLDLDSKIAIGEHIYVINYANITHDGSYFELLDEEGNPVE